MNRHVMRSALALFAAVTLCGASVPLRAAEETADLALTKSANRHKVRQGQTIVYTITVTNRGPDVARGIVFGDPIPDELNRVSFTCRDGTPTEEIAISCAVDALEPGASATAILEATPIPRVRRNERIVNTAFIFEAATPDPDSSNNSASERVKVK